MWVWVLVSRNGPRRYTRKALWIAVVVLSLRGRFVRSRAVSRMRFLCDQRRLIYMSAFPLNNTVSVSRPGSREQALTFWRYARKAVADLGWLLRAVQCGCPTIGLAKLHTNSGNCGKNPASKMRCRFQIGVASELRELLDERCIMGLPQSSTTHLPGRLFLAAGVAMW